MEKSLIDTAWGATRPWDSLDALEPLETVPQQSIDICLMCQHCAEDCDRCDGIGNITGVGKGRPRKEIDYNLLREMLRLKKCNRELCQIFGAGRGTIINAKKQLV